MKIYTLKNYLCFVLKKKYIQREKCKKKRPLIIETIVIGLNEQFIKVHQRNSLRWQHT